MLCREIKPHRGDRKLSFNQVSLQMDDINKVLAKRGLLPSGKTQKFLTNQIQMYSDKYVPFLDGMLKTKATMSLDGTSITYQSPYARYHWYGLLMIGDAPKTLTDTQMKYNGASMRGPKWTERMWADKSETIVKEVNNFMKTEG